jgi:hypothetical protein
MQLFARFRVPVSIASLAGFAPVRMGEFGEPEREFEIPTPTVRPAEVPRVLPAPPSTDPAPATEPAAVPVVEPVTVPAIEPAKEPAEMPA